MLEKQLTIIKTVQLKKNKIQNKKMYLTRFKDNNNIIIKELMKNKEIIKILKDDFEIKIGKNGKKISLCA